MGVDIHVRLIKYDPSDNLWHELKLYRKEKEEYKKVPLFEGRNSELFGIITNEENEDDFGIFPCADIPLLSLDEELRKDIDSHREWCYDFKEVLLSDMKYYVEKYPTIPDYDVDWGNDWKYGDPKPQKDNPVKWFYDDCISYASFAEGWHFGIDPYSRYKLLYWFDR